MEAWGKGKYVALVNGPKTSRVTGSAYQIISKEHEDGLRRYESEAYEVVKFLIEMKSTKIQG